MEAAVTTVLADSSAYSVGRVWRPANFAGLQTEPEDRFSGRRRSPQQPESLAAAGEVLASLPDRVLGSVNGGVGF